MTGGAVDPGRHGLGIALRNDTAEYIEGQR